MSNLLSRHARHSTQNPWTRSKNVVRGFFAAATVGLVAVTLATGPAKAVPVTEPDNIPANSIDYTDLGPQSVGQKQLIPNAVGYNQVGPNSIWQKQIAPNVIDESRLTQAVRNKLNSKPNVGDNALVSVTAVTTLINRPDSGHFGTWADDNLSRTVSITRQAAVEADKCGGGATNCWFYTGSISDIGSFTTRTGEKSPNEDVLINGQLTGSTAGGSKIQFYASSGAPNPALVPSTVTGALNPTSEWGSLFFPGGTVVTTTQLLNWAWTYAAPDTCENWVNKYNGDIGNIKGVNAC